MYSRDWIVSKERLSTKAENSTANPLLDFLTILIKTYRSNDFFVLFTTHPEFAQLKIGFVVDMRRLSVSVTYHHTTNATTAKRFVQIRENAFHWCQVINYAFLSASMEMYLNVCNSIYLSR